MAATETAAKAADALDGLYRAHVGEVYRYAYAVLGNHADAEDVTQTTFVNALRALERGERPRKPSNWLITIAHNIVRQRFRTQQARPAEVELDGDVAVEQAADTDGPSLDELVRALQRIPSSQREALVMRELEGRSYKEIQAILGLTPGALETLMFRARRSLAGELENLVTCERAELALSMRLDGRLARKERRRLDEHLRECPACARLDASHAKRRGAFKALAVLPLPLSLTLFKGAPSASAATGLSTLGAGGMAVAGGGSAGTAGGLLAGGMAVKAAALVTAVTVAGGVGYEGVKHVQERTSPRPPAAASTSVDNESATGSGSREPARVLPPPGPRRHRRARARVAAPNPPRVRPPLRAPPPRERGSPPAVPTARPTRPRTRPAETQAPGRARAPRAHAKGAPRPGRRAASRPVPPPPGRQGRSR